MSSEGSPGVKEESPSSPVMLTTMTPVSVMEYEHPSGEHKILYVSSSGGGGGVGTPGEEMLGLEHPSAHPGFLSASHYQPTPPTVLVLSELVDDMSPLLGIREESPPMAEEEGWRLYPVYYEHPLTAATSAMLNIASPPEDQPSNFIYEYYTKEKLPDLWTGGGGGTLKGSNGGLGPGTGITDSQLSDIQGLFLAGSPPPRDEVKREPEDLSHHRRDKDRHKVVLVTSEVGGHQDLVVDVVNNNSSAPIKDEFAGSPSGQQPSRTPSSTSSLIAQDSAPMEIISSEGLKAGYGGHIFGGSGSPSPIPYTEQGYASSAAAGYVTSASARSSAFTEPYYREYFAGEQSPYGLRGVATGGSGGFTGEESGGGGGPQGPGGAAASFVERYVRQSTAYQNKGVIAAAGLTVDLPSPDSGIGAEAITPRDQPPIQQSFDYSEMSLLGGERPGSHSSASSRSRPWHDFGRQNDADKIQIPKLYSEYGFKYHLETPISTNQRREDDRVTYINKGQFYGITMEYIPDPGRPLKAQTVKSIVMLMFREEKSPEDEIKAWQFWHGRQHSVKQRILDADTKNSVGFVGCIEEVAHNAIAVYWNPLESSAKLNIAVQCLSTDFSSQKGVKGLPLHVQIDTYEDPRDGPVVHRGYCQIKVFCDKGAERKTRDEERRAAKRKMAATGRKKIEELYHPPCERSEFYSMADLTKPPVLFTPAEDIDKLTSMELQGFYGHETDTSSLSNGEAGPMKHSSPFLLHSVTGKPGPLPQTLKFHNHFPPETFNDKKEDGLTTDGGVFSSPPVKRSKMIPPLSERVMLYVRQESEDVYTPLHVAPPTTSGLLNAIENKYKISASSISNLYRKNRKGIMAKIDEEMLSYYCNEDLFLLEVRHSEESEDLLDIILVELPEH